MRLVVLEIPNILPGTKQTHQFDFDSDPDRYIWVIGRQLGSDIHLVDPSVSRRHAELESRPDGFLVRDLGSSNGTFINDQRLQPYSSRLLRPGDRLRVGNVLTLLEESSLAGKAPGGRPADINVPAARPLPGPGAGPVVSQDLGSYVPTFKPQSPRGDLPPANGLKSGQIPPVNPATHLNSQENQPAYERRSPVRPSVRSSVSAESYLEIPGNVLNPPPPPAPPSQLFNTPDQPANSKAGPFPKGVNPNEYYPPAQSSPHIAGMKAPQIVKEPRRISPWLFIIPAIILVLAAAAAAVYLLVLKPAPAGPPLPGVTLPIPNFKSQSTSETVLGVNLAYPANWKKNDKNANQVIFYQPDNLTTLFNLEKPPSPTVPNASLSPEDVIKQYVSNVRQNASKYEVKQEPGSAKLRDGTPAVLTRLIFSTSTGAVVTDYNMYAVSFKCGNTLYFASAAAEGKNYNDDMAQDLDAAIGSLSCGK
jgi:pSer/pThr/pTyr-binding forkhead associated (FHA) protein